MVSTSQSANPLGAVVIQDGGTPRTYTAVAQTALSGGDLVQIFSGTATLTGSGADTFDTSDIIVQKAENRQFFNGIVTQNAGSNTKCTVATKGWYIMRAGENVSGGAIVGHNGSGNVNNWTLGGAVGTGSLAIVGVAMQSISSGTTSFGVISLGL